MNGFSRIPIALAVLSLGGASVVFGATLMEAIRVQEVVPAPGGPPALGSSEGVDGGLAPGPYPGVAETELLEAVNQDLFRPLRRPGLERYRFPSEAVAPIETRQEASGRRGPELRVVGSAIMGEAAVALVQVEDSIPVSVALGERIQGYTLARVTPESATLVGSDETLILPVMESIRVGQASTGPVQLQISSRDMERFQNRMQEVLRAQMMNERAQMMNRGIPLRETNPQRRGGRGGGGQP